MIQHLIDGEVLIEEKKKDINHIHTWTPNFVSKNHSMTLKSQSSTQQQIVHFTLVLNTGNRWGWCKGKGWPLASCEFNQAIIMVMWLFSHHHELV